LMDVRMSSTRFLMVCSNSDWIEFIVAFISSGLPSFLMDFSAGFYFSFHFSSVGFYFILNRQQAFCYSLHSCTETIYWSTVGPNPKIQLIPFVHFCHQLSCISD
jgi:hypothetical protein